MLTKIQNMQNCMEIIIIFIFKVLLVYKYLDLNVSNARLRRILLLDIRLPILQIFTSEKYPIFLMYKVTHL